MNRTFSFLFAIAFLLLAAACTGGQSPTPITAGPTNPPQATIVPSDTTLPPSATDVLTNTPTETPTPTITQTPTVTPTPTITPTPTETATPWLIWFWGAECPENPHADCVYHEDSLSYRIYSDGTGLEQSFDRLPPWPDLPSDIEIPEDENVTYYTGKYIIYLAYSPDRTKALIVVDYHLGLYLVDLASKETFILQPNSSEGGGRVNVACWSPDGSYVRFLLDPGSEGFIQLYEVKPDGSGKQLISEIQEIKGGGSITNTCSPEGLEVAFSKGFRDENGNSLYIIDMATGDVRPILLNWRIDNIRHSLIQP